MAHEPGLLPYLKPARKRLVKEGRLRANDGAMGFELATTTADGHVGELLGEEEARE